MIDKCLLTQKYQQKIPLCTREYWNEYLRKVNSFYTQIVNRCYVLTCSSAAQNVRKFYKVTNPRVEQIKVWKNKDSMETAHGVP